MIVIQVFQKLLMELRAEQVDKWLSLKLYLQRLVLVPLQAAVLRGCQCPRLESQTSLRKWQDQTVRSIK